MEDYQYMLNYVKYIPALIWAHQNFRWGRVERAIEIYKKAIFNTRNGLIWQKVEDEIGISRIDIERDLIEELEDEN